MEGFGEREAGHLLWRAGFGGLPEEIRAMKLKGRTGAVASLFPKNDDFTSPGEPDLQELAEMEQQAVRQYLEAGFASRRKLRESPEGRKFFQEFQRVNREAVRNIVVWWIDLMLHSSVPLLEKMTLFWHNHFTTSVRDVKRARWIYNQHQTLRRNALGNFRQFLLDISRDTAMLEYLDNAKSRREHPNENYARELLELFTMGEGNYTDHDVVEAARAFTGWTHDQMGRFLFRPEWHDYREKTFLGRRGNFDGTEIIDIILEQAKTAEFIVRKILCSFVMPSPPEVWVKYFASIFRKKDYEIEPVVREILGSDLMYAPQVLRAQVKSPVEFVIGSLRLMKVNLPRKEILWGLMGLMGQRLFDPPTVKGWDGGRDWISTASLELRMMFLRALLTGEIPNPDPKGHKLRKTIQLPQPPFNPERILSSDVLSQPAKATQHLLQHFIQIDLPSEKMAILQQFAEKAYREEKDEIQGARRLTYLILSLPEYQLC